MDTIITNISIRYKEAAQSSMEPVNTLQEKIDTLKKGIARTNEALTKAKSKVRNCEKETSHLISESKDEFVVDRAIDDTVTAKIKLSAISKALDEAISNLDTLKTEKTSLLHDRAHALRDLISDEYGPVQEEFLSYLEQVHNLFLLWGGLPERLAEDFGIKYGKTAVVDNPIRPLSFAQYGSDLKGFIEHVADYETTQLGAKHNSSKVK